MNLAERKAAQNSAETAVSISVGAKTVTIVHTVRDKVNTSTILRTVEDEIPLSRIAMISLETNTSQWHALQTATVAMPDYVLQIHVSGLVQPVSIAYTDANAAVAARNTLKAAL